MNKELYKKIIKRIGRKGTITKTEYHYIQKAIDYEKKILRGWGIDWNNIEKKYVSLDYMFKYDIHKDLIIEIKNELQKYQPNYKIAFDLPSVFDCKNEYINRLKKQ